MTNALPNDSQSDMQIEDSNSAETVSLVFTKHWGYVQYSTPNPLIVLALVVALVAVLESLINRFGILVGVPFVLLIVAAGIANWVYLNNKHKPDRILTREETSPIALGARVQVVGDLRELSHFADIEDAPFEPIIVERFYAASSMAFVVIVGIFIGAVIQYAIQHFLKSTLGLANAGQMLGFVLAWIPARLFPVYYRFVPGRLDVLRFSMFTGKAILLSRIDLRSGMVRVSFAKRKAEIETSEGQFLEIRLWTLAEPFRFVKGLVQAAINTHPAPPLPDDQLLG